jgi:NADPH2:quinone reductase
MRAVTFDRYGDYDELKLVTRDRPLPAAGELLVRVTFAAVNPIDSTIRSGRFIGGKPPPLIPGQEACGVVVAGVDGVAEGTRVLVRGGFGMVSDGTWAEFVTARTDQVLRAPERLDDASVAACGSGYLAAALALDRGGFSPGNSVLSLGAGGAVGNATYQLARARGATIVIGTVGSTAKAELAQSQGFANIIDLSKEKLEEGVARLTGGRGVDLIVDTIGGAMTGTALKTLADDSTLVALGYVAGPLAEINLQDLVRRRGRIQAVGLGRMPVDFVRGLFESMRNEFERGDLRPVVARSFPLEQAAEAQRFLDQERPFGKVVLQIEGPAHAR